MKMTGADIANSDSDPAATSSTPTRTDALGAAAAVGMEGCEHVPVDPAASSSRSAPTDDMAFDGLGAAAAATVEGCEDVPVDPTASSTTSARIGEFDGLGAAAAATVEGCEDVPVDPTASSTTSARIGEFDGLGAAAAVKMEGCEHYLVDVPYSDPAASCAMINVIPSSNPGVNNGLAGQRHGDTEPFAATGLKNPSAPSFVRPIASASSMGR
jgi:hypothetical protein